MDIIVGFSLYPVYPENLKYGGNPIKKFNLPHHATHQKLGPPLVGG